MHRIQGGQPPYAVGKTSQPPAGAAPQGPCAGTGCAPAGSDNVEIVNGKSKMFY